MKPFQTVVCRSDFSLLPFRPSWSDFRRIDVIIQLSVTTRAPLDKEVISFTPKFACQRREVLSLFERFCCKAHLNISTHIENALPLHYHYHYFHFRLSFPARPTNEMPQNLTAPMTVQTELNDQQKLCKLFPTLHLERGVRGNREFKIYDATVGKTSLKIASSSFCKLFCHYVSLLTFES